MTFTKQAMKNMSQPDKAGESHLNDPLCMEMPRNHLGRQRGTTGQDLSSSTSADLLQQDSNEYDHTEWVDQNENRPLYHAALRGDWENARRYLDQHPEAATAVVAPYLSTALHVAASEGHSDFVANIVELMPAEALAMPDAAGRTALHLGALAGISAKAAKAMVSKNPDLPNIVMKGNGWCPLLHAAHYSFKNKDLIWYLCLVTKDEDAGYVFTGSSAGDLVLGLTAGGHLDILLCLLERYPSLATVSTPNAGVTILATLAVTPFNFLSGSRLDFWSRFIYSCIPVRMRCGPPYHIKTHASDSHRHSRNLSKILSISTQQADQETKFNRWLRSSFLHAIKLITPNAIRSLRDAKFRHSCAVVLVQHICNAINDRGGTMFMNCFGEYDILYNAANRGITEIVKKLLQSCPELMWAPIGGSFDKTLLHIAIQNRQKELFSLLCERKSNFKSHIKTENGTILHLVAKLAPLPQLTLASGSALQMQNELQWFKAVAKLVHPSLLIYKDPQQRSAQEVFTEEHKRLAEAGEKWMKETSNSCMIVLTLIAAFVFAAAFTVPGGNNAEGVPIYLWTKAFIVFAVADALALFSSITSLLIFFSILTARYTEEDFYESLPKKLVIGLAALFLSIATMVIAFGATIYIVLYKRLKWIALPTTLLASLPVGIFVILQFPLFWHMYQSTFGKEYF